MFLFRIWRYVHAASLLRAHRSACAAAENAQQRCGLRSARLCCQLKGPVVSQAPQAGAPVTVWVKRMDLAGTQYVAVKGVDLQQTVDDFKARWVTEEKLDVRPSLVTLRLVKCGAGKPTPKQEAKAKVLDDPRLTLAGAGFTDGGSLLAFVAGALYAVRQPVSLCANTLTRRARARISGRGVSLVNAVLGACDFACQVLQTPSDLAACQEHGWLMRLSLSLRQHWTMCSFSVSMAS